MEDYVASVSSHTHELIEDRWSNMCTAMTTATEAHVPFKPRSGKKPWISEATLTLIGKKNAARSSSDWSQEKYLRREIKRFVKKNRAAYLNQLAGTGDWKALRMLRSKRRPQQTRLLDQDGKIVGSEERASTLANYLDQFKVWPVMLIPNSEAPLYPPLAVDAGLIREREVRKTIQQAMR